MIEELFGPRTDSGFSRFKCVPAPPLILDIVKQLEVIQFSRYESRAIIEGIAG